MPVGWLAVDGHFHFWGFTLGMTGSYLASRIGYIEGPIVAFRKYIFTDVRSAFGNLEERANKVATDYYNDVGSQPAYRDIDIGDVADAAQDESINWYEMMTALRQTMLNLVAAGLFHLTEQQLAALSQDASFASTPLKETKIDSVAAWYLAHLHLDIKSLPSWSLVDEFRLVANAVKHGEGSAARQLRTRRPELFSNPAYSAFYSQMRIMPLQTSLVAPLAGDDLFVSEKLLRMYAEAAESLFGEIAEHFKAHGNDFYPY